MQHTWDACITKISKKKRLISHKKIMYAWYIGGGNTLLNQTTMNTVSSKYINIESLIM